ncbi:Transient receptor potential cation channel subfamily A member 1 [Paramuricea clavata]|uniref:Transient receptor potential cation channel subfamily A member 1 n=1 Tax=Paramuricea clavata TaxID=317549 RepID=A0A6S7JL33_PARCT|nr:Transient receptor potential cation channel subfamily A member 1 [Paramuricea clavata]
MYNRDFRIRVHRSRGDSGQNEAERTNSAIRDAVVDGATIEWEHYECFDGLQDNEIAAMSLQDYEIHEAQRMEKNAWRVANQLAERIDGAPVLSEFIHGCVSEKTEDSFFFNEDYLSKYMSATKNVRSHLPGSAYFNKISDFMDTHVQSGELYSEFLRDSCQKTDGSLCQYCSENRWVGPVMTRIPRPIPDYSKLTDYSYKSVCDTSVLDSDGKEREPDDWQPRHNIRKQYEQKNLSALPNNGRKNDKMRRIIAHYFSENSEQIPENFAINREDDNESGSDEDLLIYESESSDNNGTSESEDSATDNICNPPSLVSRSGRRVGHWRTRYAN